MNKGATGLTRIIKAAGYSRQGLTAAWRFEAAFRQEVLLAVVLIPVAVWIGPSGLARAAMIGSVLLVLVAELLNAAVEAVVDRVGVEHHELSGRAKDMGSAAVLIALINVVLVWICVLVG